MVKNQRLGAALWCSIWSITLLSLGTGWAGDNKPQSEGGEERETLENAVMQENGMQEGGVGDGLRPVSSKNCQIEVKLLKSKKLPSGLSESHLSFRNDGEEAVWEVFVSIDASPMSYWGNSHDNLAIFPDGQVELYFAGPEGKAFLRPGQSKVIPVYHDQSEKHEVGRALCHSEDIFAELRRWAEIGERFGTYAPFADSSLRSLYLSSGGWGEILAGSEGRDTKEIGRRYFLSTLAYNSLSTIGGGISMMSVAASGGSSGERGYLAEASFNDAKVAFDEGRLDEAIELLERVLILEPNNALALNNLAYIMLKRGDDAGAVRPFIEQALLGDPSQPGYQNTMSLLLWTEGKKEEAIAMAAKAYTGSGGGIVEAGTNLIQWGGTVPKLAEAQENTGSISGGEKSGSEGGDGVSQKDGTNGVGQVTTTDRLPEKN